MNFSSGPKACRLIIEGRHNSQQIMHLVLVAVVLLLLLLNIHAIVHGAMTLLRKRPKKKKGKQASLKSFKNRLNSNSSNYSNNSMNTLERDKRRDEKENYKNHVHALAKTLTSGDVSHQSVINSTSTISLPQSSPELARMQQLVHELTYKHNHSENGGSTTSPARWSTDPSH